MLAYGQRKNVRKKKEDTFNNIGAYLPNPNHLPHRCKFIAVSYVVCYNLPSSGGYESATASTLVNSLSVLQICAKISFTASLTRQHALKCPILYDCKSDLTVRNDLPLSSTCLTQSLNSLIYISQSSTLRTLGNTA